MASSESEQGTGFVERDTACAAPGRSGDASWPAGHSAQEVAIWETSGAVQAVTRQTPLTAVTQR